MFNLSVQLNVLTKLLEEINNKNTTDGDVVRAIFYAIIDNIAQKIDVSLPYEEIKEDSIRQLKQYEKLIEKISVEVIKFPDLIDQVYQKIMPREYRRKFGQFFTPTSMTDFMVSWGFTEDVKRIIDPGVGTGIFLSRIARVLKKRNMDVELMGIDIDPLLLNAAYVRIAIENKEILDKVTLIKENYLLWKPNIKIDLVISNPPYMRFQDYDRQIVDYLSSIFNLQLTKLTNIYALFMMKSLSELKEGGKAVFITPSEYLYTDYGEIVKKFLLNNYSLIALMMIGLENTVFENVMTTGLITLVKKEKSTHIHEVLFVNAEGTDNLELSVLDRGKKISQQKLDPHNKWLTYFFDENLDQYLNKLVPLSLLADVDRGIETGYNEFFTLDEKTVKKYKIPPAYLKPIISKARHCPHYDFTISDWKKLKREGKRVYLLHCFMPDPPNELSEYLRYGEKIGVPKRYIISHRKRWWWVEKREPAPILVLVFSRERMRFVYNKAEVLSLTHFHLIYPKFNDETMIKALLAYLNSNINEKIATIYGRVYGTGLKKLEPGDLERLPVLNITEISRDNLKHLANLFDELCKASRQSELLEETVKSKIDETVLNILMKTNFN